MLPLPFERFQHYCFTFFVYLQGPHLNAIQLQSIASTIQNRRSMNDVDLYKVLLVSDLFCLENISLGLKKPLCVILKGANNYSFDEIQVALANCSDGDPLTWLNENWTKLIETVQTLATKYGQEHKENIVGTISSGEAREVLIKNKGSVWHAVTQCIEQRQRAYNTIKSQGNYNREDIVSTLTAHNGNEELALAELNRLQMKPFLLKIQSSPPVVENGPPTQNEEPSTSSQPDNLTQAADASSKDNDFHNSEDKRDLLRDIEAIIGSMEEKQSKQTETLLSQIENLVGNMIQSHTSRSMSSASSFSGLDHSDHLDRIHVKSPIVIPSKAENEFDQNTDVETDVKNFVSRHIQDVVPDVAALISKELVETPENIQQNESEESRSREESAVANFAQESSASNAGPSIETVTESKEQREFILEEKAINVTNQVVTKPKNAIIESNTNQMQTLQVFENMSEKVESIDTVGNKIVPVENGHFQNGHAQPLEIASTSKKEVLQQPRSNKPRLVVTKLANRFTQKQMDKRRIRELEKQLKRQQRAQRSNSIYTDRSESQNTGYLSDSTVVADDVELISVIPAVSNEKTFSLSIVEQAALVDDNKEHNQTVVSPTALSPDLLNQQSTSNVWSQSQKSGSVEHDVIDTVKDVKNRNLSELVEHTKSLIQQMKHEIDEDIAMSASEFGEGDTDGYSSDELLYSDEMGEGESEFSDSWEDISDGESIISEENEYCENYNDDAEFQRSSQSVDSEFYVEARKTLLSQNDFVYDENEANFALLDSAGVARSENFENRVEITHNEDNVQSDENVQNTEIGEHLQSSKEEENILPANSNDAPAAVEKNNAQTEKNDSTSQNTISVVSSPEPTATAMVPPANDHLMEHMLEIQQSLHTSSIVSVNFRETNLREKSQSAEPSADSRLSTPIQTPDQPEVISEETNNVELVNDFNQNNAEPDIVAEPLTGLIVESTVELITESTVESTAAETVPEQIVAQNEQINIEEEINIANQTESDPPQIESNIQLENVSHTTGESNIELHSYSIKENESRSQPLQGTSVPAVIEYEASGSESPKDDESQSQSVSISENQVSHSIDTESEMEELSVDVSTSDSSPSKDDVSIRSSISTVSVASEKLVESYQYQKITVPVTQCSSNTSINVMQLKKNSSEKPTVKNKIPVRRPSFAEPSASIRNIQNNLFNKQLKQPPKIVAKKPSRIVPPKVFFKSSPEASTSTQAPRKSKQDEPKPSTSSEKLSVPKKKYYETCFSDDNYQTSDDEKPSTSMKVIPNLVKIVESNTEEDVEVCDLIQFVLFVFQLVYVYCYSIPDSST